MQQVIWEDIIKMQPKGLLTIPKRFRQELGFAEDGLVRVKQEKGRIVLEPVRTLDYPVRSYTKEEIKEFLALDKKETKALRQKGLL